MESRWDYIRHFVTDGRQVNLDVNLEDRTVELWIHRDTPDPEDLERSAKFIGAVMLGFSTRAAMSLLHKDDFIVETWSIEEMITELKRPVDAKRLYRNIRETIMAIEDSTITKIVMVKSVLHVLGSSAKVSAAKEYIRHIISQYFLISAAGIQESLTTIAKPCYNQPEAEHTPMAWTILMMQRGIKPGTEIEDTSGNFLRNATSNLASRVFSNTIFPSREASTTPPELGVAHITQTDH
ncbi:hypothetical protein Scep_006086 [Stephania cephalantha]|uniref:Uncharacterized protein n=1 Tax=Stephania cephalantha TaxID=152367 RepID=A0AAP0K8W8_9MAGN